MFLHRDRLKAVTADDVSRVAKAYLKPENRTVGEFIPTKAPQRADVPATPDVGVMVKDYKGGEALSAGEAFDPSPAAIEARTIANDDRRRASSSSWSRRRRAAGRCRSR